MCMLLNNGIAHTYSLFHAPTSWKGMHAPCMQKTSCTIRMSVHMDIIIDYKRTVALIPNTLLISTFIPQQSAYVAGMHVSFHIHSGLLWLRLLRRTYISAKLTCSWAWSVVYLVLQQREGVYNENFLADNFSL